MERLTHLSPKREFQARQVLRKIPLSSFRIGMRSGTVKSFKIILTAGLFTLGDLHGATLVFTYNLQAGDPVESRTTLRYDSEQGSRVFGELSHVDGFNVPSPKASPNSANFYFSDAVGETSYTAGLAIFGTSMLGTALLPGLYTSAVRDISAGPGQPGLDVAFMGQGHSAMHGSFNISKISYQETGTAGQFILDTFEAAFDVADDYLPVPVYYTLRYDRVPVPEPSPPLLACAGFFMASRRKRR